MNVLPDGYRPDSRRRYPVLFLLHGVGDAYDSWALPGQARSGDSRIVRVRRDTVNGDDLAINVATINRPREKEPARSEIRKS